MKNKDWKKLSYTDKFAHIRKVNKQARVISIIALIISISSMVISVISMLLGKGII